MRDKQIDMFEDCDMQKDFYYIDVVFVVSF